MFLLFAPKGRAEGRKALLPHAANRTPSERPSPCAAGRLRAKMGASPVGFVVLRRLRMTADRVLTA